MVSDGMVDVAPQRSPPFVAPDICRHMSHDIFHGRAPRGPHVNAALAWRHDHIDRPASWLQHDTPLREIALNTGAPLSVRAQQAEAITNRFMTSPYVDIAVCRSRNLPSIAAPVICASRLAQLTQVMKDCPDGCRILANTIDAIIDTKEAGASSVVIGACDSQNEAALIAMSMRLVAPHLRRGCSCSLGGSHVQITHEDAAAVARPNQYGCVWSPIHHRVVSWGDMARSASRNHAASRAVTTVFGNDIWTTLLSSVASEVAQGDQKAASLIPALIRLTERSASAE
jgi:hypothetical protein